LHKSDVFVLPSLFEGIPLSIAEAMSTGLPIVASNVGGIPDMIADGENGLLCDPAAESIAQKIEQFLTSREKREHLGVAALKDSATFSADNMCKNYLKVYEAIVNT